MNLKGSDYIELYINWLKSNIKFDEIGDHTEISTPFLDRHNDHLQIYVKQLNGKLLLTDDSYIINDLLLSGCEIKSDKRKDLLSTILNGVGVKLGNNDELFIEATSDNFAQKKHMLLQAMLAVNDMFLTSRDKIISFFLEDVENFLELNEVRYIPSVHLIGKSGFSHIFDFVIPASKYRSERLLKTINNPSKDNAKSLLFSWTDIVETRKNEPLFYVFMNDADREIKPDVISAFSEYNVKTVLWSKRNDYLDELVS